MAVATPLTLDWQGDLKFTSGPGGPPMEVHSSTPGVPSPMHALGYAVLACMGMDIVHVLQKGRHDLKALRARFEGERADDQPRRYTKIHLHFDVTGSVPEEAVARAIQLSHEKYCSVSNSLRQDIEFKTSFTVHP